VDKPDSELLDVLRDARALLAWEAELGGTFLTEVSLAPVARGQAPAEEVVARPQAAQSPVLAAPRQPGATAQPAGQARPAFQPAPAAQPPAAAPPRPPVAAPAQPNPVPDAPQHRLQVLQALADEVAQCRRCELASTRTHTVFARGNPASPLVFVGEGPGQDEDLSGLPFVGAAGKLLDKMVQAMGYARDDVYVCNVVKCRPPNNRTPLPAEAGACSGFLHAQLDAVAPKVIVALGRCAAENMGLVEGGGWRGRWGTFRGIDVMPTYHPAFLLRSPEFKRPVWEDLQRVMQRLAGKG